MGISIAVVPSMGSAFKIGIPPSGWILTSYRQSKQAQVLKIHQIPSALMKTPRFERNAQVSPSLHAVTLKNNNWAQASGSTLSGAPHILAGSPASDWFILLEACIQQLSPSTWIQRSYHMSKFWEKHRKTNPRGKSWSKSTVWIFLLVPSLQMFSKDPSKCSPVSPSLHFFLEITRENRLDTHGFLMLFSWFSMEFSGETDLFAPGFFHWNPWDIPASLGGRGLEATRKWLGSHQRNAAGITWWAKKTWPKHQPERGFLHCLGVNAFGWW